MYNRRSLFALSAAVMILLGGCQTIPQLGGSEGNTVTGSVGGETTQGANAALEHCDEPMGTLAMVEDQTAMWWHQLRSRNLGSTTPVLRLMIQQSNCFVVVERGLAMNNMMQERALQQSGEMRKGSNYGKGQMVAADYSMRPEITFSEKGTQQVGMAFGGLVGALAAGFKKNEASTTLLLVDNRSGVQVSAAMGSAANFDWGLAGGAFSSGLGAVGGGYGNTPEGKVIVAAFADSYNQMPESVIWFWG